jgi:hypothetical protein
MELGYADARVMNISEKIVFLRVGPPGKPSTKAGSVEPGHRIQPSRLPRIGSIPIEGMIMAAAVAETRDWLPAKPAPEHWMAVVREQSP